MPMSAAVTTDTGNPGGPGTSVDGDLAVRRAQRGERAAFESVYRQHVSRVYAVCRRLAGDQGLAEDLTQEAFVRAWQNLHSYRAGTHFAAWISRLAANVCLSDRRLRGRLEAYESAPLEWEPADTAPPADPGVEIDLDRAIDALPDQARAVFVLHDIEGFRHQEIADRLGVSVGTSKSQLHRARSLLREALCR